MKGEIDQLIEQIARGLQFDGEAYPELRNATDEQRRVFAVRHNALHFAKTAGKIAAVSEAVDHGGVLNIDTLKGNVVDSLVSTLRLAEVVGMTEEELVAAIREKYPM
jgi:hypothetical protein